MRMTSCHARDIISCALHDFMFMTSFHGQSIISAAVSIIFRLLLVKLQYSHENYFFMRVTSFHAHDIMSCARHHSACTVSFHVHDIILRA